MTDTSPAHAPPALEMQEILRGQHANPFSILGLHEGDGAAVVRVFAPEAAAVTVIDRDTGQEVAALERIDPEGFFSGSMGQRRRRFAYRLRLRAGDVEWDRDIPMPLVRCWANLTNIFWPKAITKSFTVSLVRTR